MSNKKNNTKVENKAVDKTSSEESKKIEIPAFVSIESTLGAFSMLAGRSTTHKYIFAADYEWLVMPAIASKQFALFRNKKNEPIAFVSWASVSDEVAERMSNGITKLQPQDWKSGDKIYIIDILSPFVASREILTELNNKQFKGQDVNLLAPKKTGKGVEVRLLNDIISESKKSDSSKK